MNSHIKFEQIYIINEPVKIKWTEIMCIHIHNFHLDTHTVKLSKIKISTRQNTVTERVKTHFS